MISFTFFDPYHAEDIIVAIPHALNWREQEILKRRLGLGFDHNQSRREIAEHFAVSREKIRRLELVACQKLRNYLAKEAAGQ